MSNEKQLTASQRLQGLEAGMAMLDQTIANISVQNDNLRLALKETLLRQEAILACLRAGKSPTEENIRDAVVEQKAAMLKSTLEDLKNNGSLVTSNEVSDKSFIVAREVNDKGEVTNPRTQFAYQALKEEEKPAILGKKPGDLVKFGASETLFMEIEEIYDIVIPQLAEVSEGEQGSNEAEQTQ